MNAIYGVHSSQTMCSIGPQCISLGRVELFEISPQEAFFLFTDQQVISTELIAVTCVIIGQTFTRREQSGISQPQRYHPGLGGATSHQPIGAQQAGRKAREHACWPQVTAGTYTKAEWRKSTVSGDLSYSPYRQSINLRAFHAFVNNNILRRNPTFLN